METNMIAQPESIIGELADDLADAILGLALRQAFQVKRICAESVGPDDETRAWPVPRIYRPE